MVGKRTSLSFFPLNMDSSPSVKVMDRSSGLIGWFSCIYGPSSNWGKDEIWTELFDHSNLTEGAWYVGGDFNEVLYSEDRNGRTSNVQIRKFHEWVAILALVDIPIKNRQYTWSNFRAQVPCSKKHFFTSIQWLDRFPNTSLRGLPHPVSDHCPRFWIWMVLFLQV